MPKFIDPFADTAIQGGSDFVDPFSSKDSAVKDMGLADVKPSTSNNPIFVKAAKEKQSSKADPENDTGFFEDMARMFASGAVSGAEGDVKIIDYATGGNKLTGFTGQELTKIQDDLHAGLSPEMKKSLQKQFIVDGEDGEYKIGEAMSDFRAWAGTISSGFGSMATMVMTGGPLKWLAKKGINKALKNQLEKYSAKKLGKKEAQELVAKKIDSVSGIIGYGAAEGAMVTGITGKQIEQTIMALPDDVINSSVLYHETRIQIADALPDLPDDRIDQLARKQLARQMGIEGAKDVAIPSILLGSFAGHYIDRALVGRLAKTRMAGAGKAALTEAPTEAAQGAIEQYVQNIQVGKVDPSVNPGDGVANAGFAEGIGGMGAGAGMGAMAKPDSGAGAGAGTGKDDKNIDDSNVIPTEESPDTLKAQMTAVMDGRKPAMLFTPGEVVPEDMPEDLAAFDLGGKVGILVYPRENRTLLDQAKKEVMETGKVSGFTLGYGAEGKVEGSENVITVRDKDGVVIQDVVYDGSQEMRQAAQDIAGADGSIEVRTIDDSLAEREQSIPETRREAFDRLKQDLRNKKISMLDFQKKVAELVQEEVPDTEKPAPESEINQEPEIPTDTGTLDEQDYDQGEPGQPEAELSGDFFGVDQEKTGESDQEVDTDQAFDLGDSWNRYEFSDEFTPVADLYDDEGNEAGSITQNEAGDVFTAWTNDGQNQIGTYDTLGEAGKAIDDIDSGAEQAPDDRRDHSETVANDQREGERRKDSAERKKVSEMSDEEKNKALLEDPLIDGMGNLRAYQESDKKTFQVFLDADSLKFVNDEMGHKSGDILLKEMGAVLLSHFNSDVYHISGDEFVIQGGMKPQLIKKLEKALTELESVEITVVTPDNTTQTLVGLGYSYGIDESLEKAEAAMREHKNQRQEEGKRVDRGETPTGYSQTTAEGKPDNKGEEPEEQVGVSDEDFESMLDEESEPKDGNYPENLPENATDEEIGDYWEKRLFVWQKSHAKEIRKIVENYGPAEFIGIDIREPFQPDVNLVKNNKINIKKLNSARAEINKKISEDSTRYEDLRKRNIRAVTDPMPTPDDALKALDVSLELKKNHISYGNAQIQWINEWETENNPAAKEADTEEAETDTKEEIDEKAHEAATSPENDDKEPSDKQKEAENYKMGSETKLPGGIVFRSENPEGSWRFKVDREAIRAIVDAQEKNPLPKGKEYNTARRIVTLLDLALEAMDTNETVPEGFKHLEKAYELSKKNKVYDDLMDEFMLSDDGTYNAYWFNQMANHYGKVLNTVAADGDQLDLYVGHGPKIFVIDQVNPSTGEFDEHKVMHGFISKLTATVAYKKNFDKGWKGLGAITEMDIPTFEKWVKGDLTKPVSDEITISEKAESDTQTDLTTESDTEKPDHYEVWAEIPASGQGYTTFTKSPGAKLPASVNGSTFEKLGEVKTREEWLEMTNKGHDIGRKTLAKLKALFDKEETIGETEQEEEPKKRTERDVFNTLSTLGKTRAARQRAMTPKYSDYRTSDVRSLAEDAGIDIKTADNKLINKDELIKGLLNWFADNREKFAGTPPTIKGLFVADQGIVNGESLYFVETTGVELSELDIFNLNDISPIFDGSAHKTIKNDFIDTTGFFFKDESNAKAFADHVNNSGSKVNVAEVVDRVKRRIATDLTAHILKIDELVEVAGKGDKDGFIVDATEIIGGRITELAGVAELIDKQALEALVGDGPGGLNPEIFNDDYFDTLYEAAVADAKSKAKKDKPKKEKRDSLADASAIVLENRLIDIDDSDEAEQFSKGWSHAVSGGTMSNLEGKGSQPTRIGYQDAIQWMKSEKRGTKGKKQGSTGTPLRRAMDGISKVKGGTEKELEEIYKLTNRSTLLNVDMLSENATEGQKYYIDHIRSGLFTFKEFAGREYGGGRGRWSRSFSEAIADEYDSSPEGVKEFAKIYVQAIELISKQFEGIDTAKEAALNAEKAFFISSDDAGSEVITSTSDRTPDGDSVQRIVKHWNGVSRMTHEWLKNTRPYFFKDEASKKYDPTANRKTPLVRPKLDAITRAGMKNPRGSKNISNKKFKKVFGFTDITIGKSVTAKQEQDHINYAYDAFMSLSEVLGIDPINMSLGGWLHFSIGALGHGKWAAHFQPAHPVDGFGSVPVINLTNKNGNGALAHEWFHALDEKIAQNSGSGLGGKSNLIDYVTDQISYTHPTDEETKKVLKDLLNGHRFWRGGGRGNASAKKWDNLRAALYTIDRGLGFEKNNTEYRKAGMDMDKGKKDGYWSRPKELFARAGEAYIYDVMNETGQDNYLVSDWVEAGKVDKPQYRGKPYSDSDERQHFNTVFDELFKSIEWTDKGPVIKTEWEQPSVAKTLNQRKDEMREWVKEEARRMQEDKDRQQADIKIGWKGGTDLARAFYVRFANNSAPKDNRELRKFVTEFDGKKADDTRLKEAQEDFEAAMAQRARHLIKMSEDAASDMSLTGEANRRMVDDVAFNALYKLYMKQPLMNIQTTTSAKNQAYSTPAPLAYIAGRLADISQHESGKTYEPTAGNGMLTITTDPSNAIVNEIDPRRFKALEEQGFYFSLNLDALDAESIDKKVSDKRVDRVITNPPFGALKNKTSYGKAQIGQIDQLIALTALEKMKDDGKATLIIGASKVAGEMSINDRVFFNYLYSHYNVTEHFEVSGNLYARQGASWPVRVIVISGREASDKVSPKKGTIQRIETYEALYEQYQKTQYGNVVSSLDAVSEQPSGNGNPDSQGSAADEGLPEQAGDAVPDADRPDTGAEGAGSDRGSSAGGKSGNVNESEGGLGGGDSTAAAGQGDNQRGGSESTRGESGPAGGADGDLSGFGAGVDTGGDVGVSDDDFLSMLDEESERTEKTTPVIEPETADTREATNVPGYGWMVSMKSSAEQDEAILVDGYGWMIPVSKAKPKKKAKPPKKPPADKPKDDTSSDNNDDAWGQLDDIFLSRKSPTGEVDPAKYAKAKPLFLRIMQSAIDAGKTLKEALRAVIKEAFAKFGETVKPYLMKFNQDVNSDIKAGKLDNNGRPIEKVSNALQVSYVPFSKSGGIQTLTPTNQSRSVRLALKKVENEFGSVDKFLMSELEYDTMEQLERAFMGHQVDGIALAIYQLKKGKALIIGDQTGVGKGRQAAAIIRWSKINGYSPVFITAKHSLYTDMYEDLSDIGSGDIRPLITNASEAITHEDENGVKQRLFANKPAQLKKDMENMQLTGQLTENRDALFTTYDQLQPAGKNRVNKRQLVLNALAPNAVFILDESHKAAGQSGTGDFVKEILEKSGRAAYLSATYAKRPDSMPIYFLTDLSLAADSLDDLISAIESGGVPLMEIVSAQLTESGQFIRRELSWDGIEIPTWIDPDQEQQAKDEAVSDEVTERLRAIVSADRMFHAVGIPFIEENLEDIGGSLIDNLSNMADASVNHAHFTSVVHNAVAQMTLSIKADRTADMAIAAIKRGEKPVIALNSTMGSFLDDYKEMHKLQKGDKLEGFDYRVVLSRLLRRTRRITIVDADGVKTKIEIPLERLPEEVKVRYDLAAEMIDNMKSTISASPIDHIRNRIEKAGYSVKEVTGRFDRVDYSTNPPTYVSVDTSEKKDRVNTVAEFNSGELDVIVMNVAGSTGISMHAAEKFKDQRPRHMIVAQAALDINVFMQMLGRINRNGQVEKPFYTLFSTSLPAEKRPTAVTSSKMKKLNANTSSNETSATSVDAVDLMNKYGDEVVARFLHENQEFREFIQVDYDITSDPIRVADVAKKATGQVALLSVEMQRDFYGRIEADYVAYIGYLNEIGRNELVAKDIDFKAKRITNQKLYSGDDQLNPFTSDTDLGAYSVIRQGFPPTADDVRKEIRKGLGFKGDGINLDSLVGQPQELFNQHADGMIYRAQQHVDAVLMPALDEKVKKALEKMDDNEKVQANNGTQVIATAQSKNADSYNHAFQARERVKERVTETIGLLKYKFKIGNKNTDITVGDSPAGVDGVVVDVTHTWKPSKNSKGNPFAPSTFMVKIMLNSSQNHITLPMSAMDRIVSYSSAQPNLDSVFNFSGRSEEMSRESRYIVTGNLMRAYSELNRSGDIIRFTMDDGTVKQGILLPHDFNPQEDIKLDAKLANAERAAAFLREQSFDQDVRRLGISTRDGTLRVIPGDAHGGLVLLAAGSSVKGGKWWKNDKLVKLIGRDFAGNRTTKTVEVTPDKAIEVMEFIYKDSPLYALPSMSHLIEGYGARNNGSENPSAFFTRNRKPKKPAPVPEAPKMVRVATGVKKSQIDKVVETITSKWKGAPDIEVVQSISDLPQDMIDFIEDQDQNIIEMDADAKPEPVEGMFDVKRRKVWLIADEITSNRGAQRVLLHEALGHYGIRKMFGDDLKSVLRQVAMSQKPAMEKIAKEYGLDLTNDRHRLVAAEEVLAHMAEHDLGQNLIKRLFAVIREWLRTHGFNINLSDNDIKLMLSKAAGAVINDTEKADLKAGGTVAMSKRREKLDADQDQDAMLSRRSDEEHEPRVQSLLQKMGKGDQPTLLDQAKELARPGLKGRLSKIFDRFTQGSVDQFHALKLAEDSTGGVDYDRSAYVAARMSTSVDSQLMVALVRGPMRWLGNRATFVRGQKGLLDILQPIEDRIELWEAYMVAKRAERLMREGKENLLTADEIQAGIALGKAHPGFVEVAKQWARFNKTMLDFAEDAGLINPDKRAIWEHDDYIPFYRILNDDLAKGPKGKRGMSHQSSGIKQLFGGESNLNDILENMVMNTSHLLSSAMKNHAMQLAVDNLEATGLIRPAPHQLRKELIPMSQFKKILIEEVGMDQNEVNDLPDDVISGIRDMWALKTPTDKNVIRVMKNGQAEYYYVDDPMLLNSLTSIDQVAWGEWMNIFRAPKRWLTNMVTADPAFQAANFVRDTLQAFVLARDNVTPLISGIAGAKKALTKTDAYWDMLAAGGGFHSGFVNSHDPSAAAKIIKAEMRHKDFQKTIIDSPIKLWDRWQEFGSAVENANRIAVYEGALKADKSKLAAAYEAKDFMDFSMRGDYAIFNFLAQTVPFFNARLQGLYRLGRGVQENPKSFAVRGMLISFASLVLWAINKDDDRYKELQEWDKDTYWHFWVGDKHWRFPKPFEVGFVFGTMPERIIDAAYQKEDDMTQKILERFFWNMKEVFNLGALPQTIAPVFEQIANRNFFLDQPIVGLQMEGLITEEQYTPWTHETSIKIGQELGVSPARIDHVLKGYFGTIGDYALTASDMMVRRLWDFPDEAAMRPEDIPVVKRFYRGTEQGGTRYSSEFYDLIRELDKTYKTINHLKKFGDTTDARALYEKNKEELLPLPMLKQAQKSLGKIRKAVEFVHRTDTMSPVEKRAKLTELSKQKNEIYRRAMRRAKEIQKKTRK